MRNFTFAIADREAPFEPLPAHLQLTLESCSWADPGGPDQATLRIAVTHETMHEPIRYLGDSILISNENGSPVWWGNIHEVELDFGPLAFNVTVEDIANRVAANYVSFAPDGSATEGITDWVEDADSVTRYGVREVLLSFEGELAEAELFRDKELLKRRGLQPDIRDGSGRPGAILHCVGPWHRLGWQYYANPAGLVEFIDSGAGEQLLGASYTATTISFAAADDILDSANGLGDLVENDNITVSGATNAVNNGDFVVETTGAGAIEVTSPVIINEAAGNTIVISREGPKINRIGQKFRIDTAGGDWIAAKVAVRAAQVNNPTDNLVIEICANNAGVPGTVLDSVAVTGTDLFTEVDWVEAELTGGYTLVTATDYWIVVRRSGTATLAHHYAIDVNEDPEYAYGTVKVYDGSTWGDRATAANLPFRVLGKTGTLGQVRSMIEENAEFGVGSVDVVGQSNVQTWQYRDGTTLALDEIVALLDIGTNTGEALTAQVTPERRVLVSRTPVASDIDVMLHSDGTFTTATGAPLDPATSLAGRWVIVNIYPLMDAFNTRALYIQSCEYDARRDKLTITPDGARKAWHLTRARQG